MVQTHRKTGAIYVALSGLFFGFIGYFGVSIVHANISVNTMLFWRFLVASVFMCVILLPQFRALHAQPRDLIKSLVYGVFFYGPSSTLYFMAANSIGSGLAMVLFYTFPAMVLLMDFVITKHAINPSYYVAVGIIIMGMTCLTFGDTAQFNLKGVGYSILSAFLFALYMIFSKSSTASAQVDTLTVCLGSTLSALMMALLEHRFVIPNQMDIWINIIAIGTVCTSVPILLLLKGLKNISALQASILSVLEPVFVIFFGVMLLGESITALEYVGVATLLSGALLALVSAH
jgi:drug/metabolite transporter (DMT)-like permease